MKDAGLLPHASQAAMGPRVMRYRQPGDSSLQQKADQVLWWSAGVRMVQKNVKPKGTM